MKYEESIEIGKKSEVSFETLMRKYTGNVKPATLKQNIEDHIDYFVNGKSIDVKSRKRINRHDKNFSNIIWLERTNVKGGTGWLYGKAEFIAFETETHFWVIKREDLVAYVEDNIPCNEILLTKGYKTWYQRDMSVITYVNPEDIEHLIFRKYKI